MNDHLKEWGNVYTYLLVSASPFILMGALMLLFPTSDKKYDLCDLYPEASDCKESREEARREDRRRKNIEAEQHIQWLIENGYERRVR